MWHLPDTIYFVGKNFQYLDIKMASANEQSNGAANVVPSVEPEVALLLTNEENLCEKVITLLLKVNNYTWP